MLLRRSSGGLSGCLTEEGWFASQDVRYRKKDSSDSVSSGSSYQRYLDSGEDPDTKEEDSSDQESCGSLERRLSDIAISCSAEVLPDSPRPRGLGDLSSPSSLRGSIGRGNLVDRLKRRSEVRARAGSTLN